MISNPMPAHISRSSSQPNGPHPLFSLAFLIVVSIIHAVGFILDSHRSVSYPFQIDYGEGILWQQALLIPGPDMYRLGQEHPFFVFNYPPVFFLLVRACGHLMPDLLSAGRLLSGLSSLLCIPLIALLVQTSNSKDKPAPGFLVWSSGIAAGLCSLCLPNVRAWGLLMRVDMLAIALSLLGLLVCARSRSTIGAAIALLLCGAAVFTKQTELSAGIAVFMITCVVNLRRAFLAAALAGTLCLIVVMALEYATQGGFLDHIILYNINRLTLASVYRRIAMEAQMLPFLLIVGLAFYLVGRQMTSIPLVVQAMRQDESIKTRGLLLVYFVASGLFVACIAKEGSGPNYFIEWYVSGCIMIGLAFIQLDAGSQRDRFCLLVGALSLAFLVSVLPAQILPAWLAQQNQSEESRLVDKIRAARLPVASENMTAVVRAGKPVLFDPAIALELSMTGRWDERPLLAAIHNHRFEFMVVGSDPDEKAFWSDQVRAEMNSSYPRVEASVPGMIVRYPQ